MPLTDVHLYRRPNAFLGAFASVVTGKVIDRNYRRIAKKLDFPLDRKRGDDLTNFPIEKARLQMIFPMLYIGIAAILCYGWALEKRSMLAGPLVLQGIIGFSISGAFNAFNTLIIDLYPMNPSAVTAGNNLCRCALGALSTAVFNLMIKKMGIGWCFTFWALVSLCTSSVLFVVIKKGPEWREARRIRVAKRQAEKEKQKQANISELK